MAISLAVHFSVTASMFESFPRSVEIRRLFQMNSKYMPQNIFLMLNFDLNKNCRKLLSRSMEVSAFLEFALSKFSAKPGKSFIVTKTSKTFNFLKLWTKLL